METKLLFETKRKIERIVGNPGSPTTPPTHKIYFKEH